MGAGDHLKRKEAILVRKKEATAPQGFGILKKRKEASAALKLWALENVPGGMDTWMDRWLEMKAKAEEEEAAEAAGPAKKRKRVVKQRLPKALIDLMVASPYRTIEDLTPAQLANHSHEYRQLHALTTFINGKMRDYEQALIDQYNAQGYAEDESEVTDNEEEEVDGAAAEK